MDPTSIWLRLRVSSRKAKICVLAVHGARASCKSATLRTAFQWRACRISSIMISTVETSKVARRLATTFRKNWCLAKNSFGCTVAKSRPMVIVILARQQVAIAALRMSGHQFLCSMSISDPMRNAHRFDSTCGLRRSSQRFVWWLFSAKRGDRATP